MGVGEGVGVGTAVTITVTGGKGVAVSVGTGVAVLSAVGVAVGMASNVAAGLAQAGRSISPHRQMNVYTRLCFLILAAFLPYTGKICIYILLRALSKSKPAAMSTV